MSLEQALGELQELTARLRRECPWDADQTARTIVPHTVEEAYEVADAAMADDDAKLVDELGDLLYQTFFLSLLLSERGAGDLETVARGVHDKLVRRHPHVFGDADSPGSPEAVKRRWEELKTEQEGERASSTTSRSPCLRCSMLERCSGERRRPALFLPTSMRVWPVSAKSSTGLRGELQRAGTPPPETEPDPKLMEALGDVLFDVVAVSAALNIDLSSPCAARAGGSWSEWRRGSRERDRSRRFAADPRLARQPDGRGRRRPRVGCVRPRRRPCGASTGEHEADELRDGDPEAYLGKGVLRLSATSSRCWARA